MLRYYLIILLYRLSFSYDQELCAKEGQKCKNNCTEYQFKSDSLSSCILQCQKNLDSCLDQALQNNQGLQASPMTQLPPTFYNESDVTRTEGYGFHEGYDVLGNTLNGNTETKNLMDKPTQEPVEPLEFIPIPGMTPLGDRPLHFADEGLPEPPDPNSGAFNGPIGRTPDSGFFHQKQERKIFDHDLDVKVRDRQKWEHQLQEVGLLWGDAMNQATRDMAAAQPLSFKHNPGPSGKTVPPTQNGVYFGFPATQQMAQSRSPSFTPTPTRTYRYTPAETGPTELFKPTPSSPTRFSSLYSPHSSSPQASPPTAFPEKAPSTGIVTEPPPADIASAAQRSHASLTRAAKQLPNSISDISTNRFADPESGDLIRAGKGFILE